MNTKVISSFFTLCFLLMVATSLVAQDLQEDSPAAFKNEVSVDLRPVLLPLMGAMDVSTEYNAYYTRQIGKTWYFNVGGSFVRNDDIVDDNSFNFINYDSISVRHTQVRKERHYFISAGLQWRYQSPSLIQLFLGADLIGGPINGEDNLLQQNYIQNADGTTQQVDQSERLLLSYSGYALGVKPYFGVRTEFGRLGIGVSSHYYILQQWKENITYDPLGISVMNKVTEAVSTTPGLISQVTLHYKF